MRSDKGGCPTRTMCRKFWSSRNSAVLGTLRGFTLLEVLVAVAILGIALTTLHYAHAQGIRAQAVSQNMAIACLKAMEFMYEANFTRFEELLPRAGEVREGTFDPPYEFLHWKIRVEENEFAPEILNVFLSVTWETESGPRRAGRRSGKVSGENPRGLEICFYRSASLR